MRTNLDSMFRADEASEKNGIWFTVADGVGFQVRRFSEANPRVRKALAKYHAPFARQIQLGQLAPEKESEINVKVFVECCLVDWKGIEIDGKEVPFSKEKAVEVLTAYPELFRTLWTYSQDFANFKADFDNDGEELGNF